MAKNFFTWNFCRLTLENLIDLIKSSLESKSQSIHFIASHALSEAYKDSELFEIFEQDLVVSDGKPLSIYLNFCGSSINQIRGTDFMRNFLLASEKKSIHFFLGSTRESHIGINRFILQNLRNDIESHFYSPEFGSDWKIELKNWLDEIERIRPDYVWVGMGAPKQFKIAHEITKRLGLRTFSVGAAFDFVGNTKKESPAYLNRIGLEWAYRFSSEPKRLFRRYTLESSFFILILIRQTLFLIWNRLSFFISKFS